MPSLRATDNGNVRIKRASRQAVPQGQGPSQDSLFQVPEESVGHLQLVRQGVGVESHRPSSGVKAAVIWQLQALCAEDGYQVWFLHDHPAYEGVRIDICGRCPVKDDCLTDALLEGEKHGVWGGMNPDTRARSRLIVVDGEWGAAARTDRTKVWTALGVHPTAIEALSAIRHFHDSNRKLDA